MSARSFKSVGWVAAVGAAALGCYMLSLRVATERNDLARVESQIVAAKQDIRSLQTELGTRGRLSQLERWNAEVLALSAPVARQFLTDEFTLARLDRREQSFEQRADVRMASAETEAPAPAAPQLPALGSSPPVRMAAATAAKDASPLVATVHQAAYAPPTARNQATKAKPSALLDEKLVQEIGAAARGEKSDRAGGTE